MTISREVLKDTVLEVSYVGNHGLHLWRSGVPYNDVVPSARLAIAQAALREGKKVGQWDVAVAAASEAAGLNPAALLASEENRNPCSSGSH